MDVTYAVVNKARRGGGAGGRDHAPSAGRDHAPSFGRDPAPAAGGDPAPSPGRDSAPRGFGSAPSGTASLPGSPLRRPSPHPAASPPPGDGAYEVVTPQGDAGTSPRLGFNFRIAKPKGPREPPAEWSRV